jgi:hypothetical protein
VKTKSTYNSRTTTADEQRLYSHLLACVSVESPDAMIDRFQALFLDGFGYPDREVVTALDQLLGCHEIEESFRFILNRCCHILINRWQTNTQLQPAIPVLVDLLESPPPSRVPELSRSRAIRRLHHVTRDFLDTEQYLALKRLARVIEARHSTRPRYRQAKAVPLGSLIDRYPYLYEHCLVTEDSDLQHQQYVRTMQVEAQHKFEVDLSHYVTYRVRQGRMYRQGRDDFAEKLRVVPNPTLLNDHDLASSLRHFARHRDHGQSYRDGAQRFLLTHDQGASYRQFKEDLFDYIMADVNVGYGQRQFKTMLQDHLLSTYNDSDGKPVDDFLKVRTCSNLFNFLVVDPSAGRQHYVFLDLINNLGPVHTTGLLLRILLICQKVRPFVERRFSLLFNHYETASSETVEWLVHMFENINIALSLNFGSVDLSHPSAR